MVLNKKGIVALYYLMLGIVIIILALALAFPSKEIIDINLNELNCTATTNVYDKGTCYFIDSTKVIIVGGLILVGLSVISLGAK